MSPSRTQVWYGEKYIHMQTVTSNVTHMISATFTLSLIVPLASLVEITWNTTVPLRSAAPEQLCYQSLLEQPSK